MNVGWVINESCGYCMCCGHDFSLILWRHHCRSCGNLVCYSCLSMLYIKDYHDLSEQKVCVSCRSSVEEVQVMIKNDDDDDFDYGDNNEDE